LFDCKVCLTDQECILSQLQHNVENNFEDSNQQKIVARPLSWSKESKQSQDFNIVLNCDYAYEPLYWDLWKLLVVCIDELLQNNPKALVVTSIEQRTADGIDQFLAALQELPHVLTVTKACEDVDCNIEIYVARGNITED